jgi:antitoxin HigA-1
MLTERLQIRFSKLLACLREEEMSNNLLAGLGPVHPGEVLREDVFPGLNKPMAELARLLSTSRTTLYSIMKGEQSVTSDMALRIGKLTGTTPEMWLNLQQAYDLRLSEARLADELKKIPTLEAA